MSEALTDSDLPFVEAVVRQQAAQNPGQFIRTAADTHEIGKSFPIDSAIATHRDHTSEQGISSDLAGNRAAVHLENDAMGSDEAEVIRIR